MKEENEFLITLREANRINKEDEEAYIKQYEEFAKIVQSGKFKIQDEDEQND